MIVSVLVSSFVGAVVVVVFVLVTAFRAGERLPDLRGLPLELLLDLDLDRDLLLVVFFFFGD